MVLLKKSTKNFIIMEVLERVLTSQLWLAKKQVFNAVVMANFFFFEINDMIIKE